MRGTEITPADINCISGVLEPTHQADPRCPGTCRQCPRKDRPHRRPCQGRRSAPHRVSACRRRHSVKQKKQDIISTCRHEMCGTLASESQLTKPIVPYPILLTCGPFLPSLAVGSLLWPVILLTASLTLSMMIVVDDVM
jgi:hypothetical protein